MPDARSNAGIQYDRMILDAEEVRAHHRSGRLAISGSIKMRQ